MCYYQTPVEQAAYIGSGEDSTKEELFEMDLCEDKWKFTWQKIKIRTF